METEALPKSEKVLLNTRFGYFNLLVLSALPVMFFIKLYELQLSADNLNPVPNLNPIQTENPFLYVYLWSWLILHLIEWVDQQRLLRSKRLPSKRFRHVLGINLPGSLSGLACFITTAYLPLYLVLTAVCSILILLWQLKQPAEPGPYQKDEILKALIFSAMLFGFFLLFPPFDYLGNYPRRPKSAKANMHTLQTMVEAYAVNWKGVYPESVIQLKQDGTQIGNEYWRDFNNPITGLSGLNASYADYQSFLSSNAQPYLPIKQAPSFLGISFQLNSQYPPPPYRSGLALYRRVTPRSYIIFGTDLNGYLIREKGSAFTLSGGDPPKLTEAPKSLTQHFRDYQPSAKSGKDLMRVDKQDHFDLY